MFALAVPAGLSWLAEDEPRFTGEEVTDPRNVSQLVILMIAILSINPSIRSPLEHDAFSDLSPAPLSPAQLYHRTDVASSSGHGP